MSFFSKLGSMLNRRDFLKAVPATVVSVSTLPKEAVAAPVRNQVVSIPDLLVKRPWLFSIESVKELGISSEQYRSMLVSALSYSPHSIYDSDYRMIGKLDEETQVKLVEKDILNISYVKNPSLNVQLAAVNSRGWSIRYIDNPCDQVKIAAIKNSPRSIEAIKNPTDEMKLMAIESDVDSMRYIKNPTEEMKWMAINKGISLSAIDNPTLEMQLTAIKINGENIACIGNPTDEMMWIAIRSRGASIRLFADKATDEMKFAAIKSDGAACNFIPNPTREMFLEAVKVTPSIFYQNTAISKKYRGDGEICLEAVSRLGANISSVCCPTEEMKLAAVYNDGLVIRHIVAPTEEMKLIAVKQNGYAIEYIKDPPEEMKLIAVRNRGGAIAYIKNPTEEMKIEAIKNDPECIRYIHTKDITDQMKWLAFNIAYSKPVENKHFIDLIKNPPKDMQLKALEYDIDILRFIDNPCLEAQKYYLERVFTHTPTQEPVQIRIDNI